MLFDKSTAPLFAPQQQRSYRLDMARRKLTAEERADAKRLSDLWVTYQRTHNGISQEAFSGLCGWKTQSAFSQYVRGIIPLNLRALLKIAANLGVAPSAISPRLAATMAPESDLSPKAVLFGRLYDECPKHAQRELFRMVQKWVKAEHVEMETAL